MPVEHAHERSAEQHGAAYDGAADAARTQNAPGANNNTYRVATSFNGGAAATTPNARIDSTGITFDAQTPTAPPASQDSHWYSGAAAVAADLFTGAKNEVVNHPGRVVGSAAIGVAAVAAAPALAAGAAALGVGTAAIATGTAVLEGTMAAVGTAYAAYKVWQHGGETLHNAGVVANPQNFSKNEQQKAHAGLQDAGAIGLDLVAGGLTAVAAGAVRGSLAGTVRGTTSGAEGSESGAGVGRGASAPNKPGEAPGKTKDTTSGDPNKGAERQGQGPADGKAPPHAPPDTWPKGIVDKTEPPVKDGFTRLYRGVKQEAEKNEFQKPLSEEEAHRFREQLKVFGEKPLTPAEEADFKSLFERSRADFKWYTDDLKTARDYSRASGKILYVDVPTSEVRHMYRVTGHIGSARPADAFEVPYEWTKTAREDVHSPTNIYTQPPVE